jgi:hypothetical protein
MKWFSFSLAVVLSVILVSCESQISEPDTFTTAPVVSLAKVTTVATIESNPPTGTFYSDPQYPDSSIQASGNDELPPKSSVWNDYTREFSVTLNSAVIASWLSLSSVTIENPVETEYLNSSDLWITVLTNSTVSCKAVRTGGNGSTKISTDIRIDDLDSWGGRVN